MKKRNIAIIAGVLVAALLGLAGWLYFGVLEEQSREADASPYIEWMFIDAGDFELVRDGRKVYEAYCAECHGYGLKGEPNWQRRGPDGVLPAPPHDETGHTWHHPDAVLFATVKLGGQAFMPTGMTSGMPGYADILSDREIEASLAYIKSRWPSKIRRQQEMRNMQSRSLKR
jgi:mono/diheme cytochrome c family protein